MKKLSTKKLTLVGGITLALLMAGCGSGDGNNFDSSGRDNDQGGSDGAEVVFTNPNAGDDENTAGGSGVEVLDDLVAGLAELLGVDLSAVTDVLGALPLDALPVDVLGALNDITGAIPIMASDLTTALGDSPLGDVLGGIGDLLGGGGGLLGGASAPSSSRSAMIDALDAGAAGLITKDSTRTALAAVADPLLDTATVGYLADAVNNAFTTATAEGSVSPENLSAALSHLGSALAELGSAEGTEATAAHLSSTLAVVVNGLAGGLEGNSDAVAQALEVLTAALDVLVASTQLSEADQTAVAALRASL